MARRRPQEKQEYVRMRVKDSRVVATALPNAPHQLQGRGAVARPRRVTCRWSVPNAIRWPRPGSCMRLLASTMPFLTLGALLLSELGKQLLSAGTCRSYFNSVRLGIVLPTPLRDGLRTEIGLDWPV